MNWDELKAKVDELMQEEGVDASHPLDMVWLESDALGDGDIEVIVSEDGRLLIL